ncbi:ANTAR domain-containing protein [Nocardia asteroides]
MRNRYDFRSIATRAARVNPPCTAEDTRCALVAPSRAVSDRDRRVVVDVSYDGDGTTPSDFDPVAARAVIEQAKGAVMLVYGLDADAAFAMLRVRSQETNTKLRVLAANVAAELPSIGLPAVTGELRSRVNRLLATAHEQPR